MNIPSCLLIVAICGTISTGLAWLITKSPRVSSSWAHLVWLLALATPLLSVIVSLSGWRVGVPLLPTTKSIPASNDLPSRESPVVSAAQTPLDLMESRTSAAVPRLSGQAGPVDWIPLVWGAGFLSILVVLISAHLRLRLILKRCGQSLSLEALHRLAPILNDRRSPRLLRIVLNSGTNVPFCYGLFHPVIALPMSAESWKPDILRACLSHEIAHIRRGDLLTLTLAQICCALCWFHPLMWYGLKKLRVCAELAADDATLDGIKDPSSYAASLLEIAAGVANLRYGSVALSMAQPSLLRMRIASIIDGTRRRRAPGTIAAMSAFLILSGLLLGGFTLRLVAAEPDSRPATGGLEPDGAFPPDITTGADGHIELRQGITFARGDARLRYGTMAFQADRLEYDPKLRVIRLFSKPDPKSGDTNFATVVLNPSYRPESSTPVPFAPLSSMRPDICDISGGDSRFDHGVAIVTEGASIQYQHISLQAPALHYNSDLRGGILLQPSSSASVESPLLGGINPRFHRSHDGYEVAAVYSFQEIPSALHPWVERFLTAIRNGDAKALRGYFLADYVTGVTDADRKALLDAAVAKALALRTRLPDNVEILIRSGIEHSRSPGKGSGLRGATYVQLLGEKDGKRIDELFGVMSLPSNRIGFFLPANFSLSAQNSVRPGKRLGDAILARVNDQAITQSEVDRFNAYCSAVLASGGANPGNIETSKTSALDGLIDRTLLLQGLEKEKELEGWQKVATERIEEIVKNDFRGDHSAFKEALDQWGFTRETFQRFMAENYALEFQNNYRFAAPDADAVLKKKADAIAALRASAQIQIP